MNTLKQIICAECGKEIKSIKNLATGAKYWFFVKPYHFGCFQHFVEVPRFTYTYFPFQDLLPLNHQSNKWYIFTVLSIVGLLPIVLSVRAMILEPPTTPFALIIFGPIILISLLLLGIPYARTVSYYKYEKPLTEKKHD